MNKYRATVIRTSISEVELEVLAKDEKEAMIKLIDKACNVDYSSRECDSSYAVNLPIKQVDDEENT